ncbi:hypothetical protein AMJ49_05365 [Parcubacteria bacterium DG_74_2]|nr:MAG: hypothetical protein AMJ49_05365 [Parcubacteria bacterium DG_74_2]
MKKTLIINTTFSKGGAARIAQSLYGDFKKAPEFSSYFTYGRGSKRKEEKVFKFSFFPEVFFHGMLTRLTGLQGHGSYFSTKRLEKFILKEKFVLIHLHNLHGYYLNLSFVKFLGKLNIPIIWTLHDAWPITGRCSYFLDCNRWKSGCWDCPNLSWYPKTYFDSSAFMWKRKREAFNSGWNPVIVCPSEWLADQVRESYLAKFKIEVIPNGINTEIFKPKDKTEIRKRLRVDLNKKIILFVADKLTDERKGAKYFFEALNYIKNENWQVLTLGSKFGLVKNDKIKELGYVSNLNFISDVYNAADLFCTTAIDESFGLTTTESMACGVPVVGFRTGGIQEQVSEKCGIIVDKKNTKKLAVAIEELLNNNQKRKESGLNCREKVLRNYSIEKFKQQYMDLYETLLIKR